MSNKAFPARITPITVEDRSDELLTILDQLVPGSGRRPGNFLAVVAHHPALLRAWIPFIRATFFDATLPERDTELVILRTAWLCQAPYEWETHVTSAHRSGLTQEDIERVTKGPDALGWNEFEAALLRAADELHHESAIRDSTWSVLATRYDASKLIEVTLIIGQYNMLAWFLNSAGVQPFGDSGLDAR